MKYILYSFIVFSIWLAESINANSSEKHHDDDHENVVNVVEKTSISNVTVKNLNLMPDVQYQFNPNSNKYQMSLGAATSDFESNNAFGMAIGKKIQNNSFIHGSIKTNGRNTGGNIGLTFSID